jgi:histidyl-tRNA synthetase
VYRGERAQRGRFREFYQCDIDVVGKDSLSIRYDAELPAVIYSVFRDLAIGPFTIQLNNRKFLRGFMQASGIIDEEMQTLVLREIDKVDKRGVTAVHATLQAEPFALSSSTAQNLLALFDKQKPTPASEVGATFAQLEEAIPVLRSNDLYLQGRDELLEIFRLIRQFGVPDDFVALNTSIARGLDYYTGTVYETILNEHPQIGSICSGGRYENLASNYTKSRLPGVGISIGATRLFWQLREAKLLGAVASTVQVLVAQMDDALLPACLEIATQLRNAGIATEVVLDGGKLGKQFKYADRAGIRFVLVLGPDEVAKGTVAVKDMRKQDQFEVPRAELAKIMRVELEQTQVIPA